MSTQQLSEQEKRVKIAVAVGWDAFKNLGSDGGWIAKTPSGQTLWDSHVGGTPNAAIANNCPDYFTDLNAMAEAEKAAFGDDDGKWHDFTDHLRKILNADTGWEYTDIRLILRATAAQRAEAFGLTLGLWT